MKRVVVIAEAGVNHNGELNKALKLIDIAAYSGADYVKFQTFNTNLTVTKRAKKADYQKNKLIEDSDFQFEMLKNLEIPDYWYSKLLKRCKEQKIGFLSTGFDIKSIDFLDSLGMSVFKIPSGEINHKTLLRKIAQKSKPVIMSTGISTKKEIKNAIEILLNDGLKKSDITILHCNSEYPTPLEQVNMLAMLDIRSTFNVKVGFSDHTLGIEASLAAVSLGAEVIEKHFTIDKNLDGPDHKSSLEPQELKTMIDGIRIVSTILSGSGIKEPTGLEINNKEAIRKSLYFNNQLKKGTRLEEKHIVALRPGDGISPMKINFFIGKKLNNDVELYQKCSLKDII